MVQCERCGLEMNEPENAHFMLAMKQGASAEEYHDLVVCTKPPNDWELVREDF